MNTNPSVEIDQVMPIGGYNAVATFKDGHRMTFYQNNFHEGVLRRSELTIRERLVFSMRGRAGHYMDENDHKIEMIDPSYTQQRVAEYWEAIIVYIEREYPNNTLLRLPKILICNYGRRDYEALRNGTAEMIGK